MASSVAGVVMVVSAIQGPRSLWLLFLAIYILPGTRTVFVSSCVGGGGAVVLGILGDLLPLDVVPLG
ncbi:hypothetical protein CCHOA_09670 [Corynebacterium choanae]|uniref:Uncharacterized protein n=1 Tax=Corynebacterium choanae TaxID=1862358 RepID=A0A3G6J8C9_9CORY|nr:hypothetical protein CCHOA_09670 [Corynebacterium choanae]